METPRDVKCPWRIRDLIFICHYGLMGLDSPLSGGCKLWKIRSCYVSRPCWPLKVWIMRFWRSVSGAGDFEVSRATSPGRPADCQLQIEEVGWHSRTRERVLRDQIWPLYSSRQCATTLITFAPKKDSSILIPHESKQKSCYLMDLVCGRCQTEQFGSCSGE